MRKSNLFRRCAGRLVPQALVIGLLVLTAASAIEAASWHNALSVYDMVRGPTPALQCPAQSVPLPVGTDPQSILNQHPNGTTFCLKAGVHRRRTIYLGTGDKLIGEFGATLRGSKVLPTWQTSGSLWFVWGQAQQGTVSTRECDTVHYCTRPEQLFRDGVLQTQVSRLQDLDQPNEWYFDYAADRIYVSSDPTSSVIEASVTSRAIVSGVNSVIKNIQIDQYATPATESHAVVTVKEGTTLEKTTIKNNAGTGVFITGSNVRVLFNILLSNGFQGFRAWRTQDALFVWNEVALNNTKGFALWGSDAGAGGGKVAESARFDLRRNWLHNNFGNGVWFDIENFSASIAENIAELNARHGIYYEISSDAEIRDNISRRNHEGGIIISNSRRIKVHGNRVAYNGTGIVGLLVCRGADFPLEDVEVFDNEIVAVADSDLSRGLAHNRASGIWVRTSCSEFANIDFDDWYEVRGNTFTNNDYWLTTGVKPLFLWTDGSGKVKEMNASEWTTSGNDVLGVFRFR